MSCNFTLTTMRGSPNLATKVIFLAAAAVVLATGATYVAVYRQMWSELEARQRSEGEQHLRALALVFAKRVPNVRVDLDGQRVVRVVAPPLSAPVDETIVDDSVSMRAWQQSNLDLRHSPHEIRSRPMYTLATIQALRSTLRPAFSTAFLMHPTRFKTTGILIWDSIIFAPAALNSPRLPEVGFGEWRSTR